MVTLKTGNDVLSVGCVEYRCMVTLKTGNDVLSVGCVEYRPYFICSFVFILSSTAKVISEHRPINVVSQPGIEPETLRFKDNHGTD